MVEMALQQVEIVYVIGKVCVILPLLAQAVFQEKNFNIPLLFMTEALYCVTKEKNHCVTN